ncbi:MAG: hypothetical protein GEV06_21730 [Luteitalea sp.]|nr:hypothetical protein [Luteitalea sp.]
MRRTMIVVLLLLSGAVLSAHIPMTPFIERIVKPDQLDEVIGEADVLFVAAPHTERSHHMIGPAQFARMKQGSYFIAVSRGALYDLEA